MGGEGSVSSLWIWSYINPRIGYCTFFPVLKEVRNKIIFLCLPLFISVQIRLDFSIVTLSINLLFDL